VAPGRAALGTDREDNNRMTSGQLIETNDANSHPRLIAADLLGQDGIVQIEHEGAIYTLRLTRNNRLILTK
jgi:hemin uptake protein HemP